jgi:hypothetical protein
MRQFGGAPESAHDDGMSDLFDLQDWPIKHGGRYRAVDPPKPLADLVVTVTHMEHGVITAQSETGQVFEWPSAAEFRRHHRPA